MLLCSALASGSASAYGATASTSCAVGARSARGARSHLGEVPRASGRVGLACAELLRRKHLFYARHDAQAACAQVLKVQSAQPLRCCLVSLHREHHHVTRRRATLERDVDCHQRERDVDFDFSIGHSCDMTAGPNSVSVCTQGRRSLCVDWDVTDRPTRGRGMFDCHRGERDVDCHQRDLYSHAQPIQRPACIYLYNAQPIEL